MLFSKVIKVNVTQTSTKIHILVLYSLPYTTGSDPNHHQVIHKNHPNILWHVDPFARQRPGNRQLYNGHY
jgi:hypothetical protein